MSAKRAMRGTVAMIIVGLLAAACNTGPSEETLAFCEDYLEVRALLNTGPDESNPGPWVEGATAGLEAMKASAPDEVSGSAGRMADSLLAPIAQLDQEAFFAATLSDEFVADSAVIDSYVIAECDVTASSVTAIDYAFNADLDSLEPGQVAFEFENAGTELHEMALIRINDGVTQTIDELLALPEEEAMALTTFAGVSFAAPGDGSTMFAELDAGRYVIICFIPQGTTSFDQAEGGDGPPHFTLGMVKEFTVEGS